MSFFKVKLLTIKNSFALAKKLTTLKVNISLDYNRHILKFYIIPSLYFKYFLITFYLNFLFSFKYWFLIIEKKFDGKIVCGRFFLNV